MKGWRTCHRPCCWQTETEPAPWLWHQELSDPACGLCFPVHTFASPDFPGKNFGWMQNPSMELFLFPALCDFSAWSVSLSLTAHAICVGNSSTGLSRVRKDMGYFIFLRGLATAQLVIGDFLPSSPLPPSPLEAHSFPQHPPGPDCP